VGDNTRFLKDAYGDLLPFIKRFEERLRAGQPITADELEEFKNGLEEADWEYLQEEIPKAIEQSLEGVKRVSRIVQAMKEFSHSSGGEKTAVDLNHAIKNTVTVARNEWKYVADMELNLEDNVPSTQCQPGEMNQVFLNMVVNAAHAVEDALKERGETGKGKIIISSSYDEHWVEIRIRDTGTGIPEKVRDRIFDPFFTTKEVGRGSGQGLSISYDIVVNKHNGEIDFETEPGKGTTFIIRLPRKAMSLAEPAGGVVSGKGASV
jgi:signal transduction histidine kinase